jgi:hypothetical protein
MEYKMKTTLLLSTLAVALMGATPSFAQATNMGPSRPYDAQGYEGFSPTGPADRQFGPSDYGYQRRIGTGRVQAPRARHRAPLSAVEPTDKIR